MKESGLNQQGPAQARVGPDEYVGIFVFFSFCALIALRVHYADYTGPQWIPWIGGGLGLIASDFCSGLVHWGFDTWGSPSTPFVGPAFLIPFREHHRDQKEITRHGFVETNGNNCLITIPVLAGSFLVPLTSAWSAGVVMGILVLCLGTFLTNQFHKWAHQDHVHPLLIRTAQRYGVILSPEHHAAHHAAPFSRSYCITNGWMNPILDRIGFFRRAERVVTVLTGARPRVDDLASESVAEPGLDRAA